MKAILTKYARFGYQATLVLGVLALALGLRAAAFTETASSPTGGTALSALNTGSNSQDKAAPVTHDAWITTDGLGSRYSASFATQSGTVGIGLVDPTYASRVGAKVGVGTPDATTALGIGNTAGTPRFALNPQSDGGWAAYDYGNGAWAYGLGAQGGNVGVGVYPPTVKLDVASNKAVGVGNLYISSGSGNVANLATNAWNNGGWNVYSIGELIQLAGQVTYFWRSVGDGSFWLQGYVDNNGNTVAHGFCALGVACGATANTWTVVFNTRRGDSWSDPCLTFYMAVSSGIIFDYYGDHGDGPNYNSNYCG